MAGPSQQSGWGTLSYTMLNASTDPAIVTADVNGVRFVIGRAKGCDLQIGMKMISARHCYLERELASRKAFLVDTSTNGTFVNAQKVSNGQRQVLSDGDKLFLVRKKVDPSKDFYIIFRYNNSNDEENLAFDLDNEEGHSSLPAKRFKGTAKHKEESAFPVAVKSELVAQPEEAPEPQEAHSHQDLAAPLEMEATSDSLPVKPDLGSTSQDTSKTESMEEMFKCSLCLEILYDPVCIQPCMHCYCSGCYSEWMAFSQNCPQCRCNVQRLARNHMISSLLEAFLKSNPDKRRSQSEIDKLNSKNIVTKEMLCMTSRPLQTNSQPLSRCPINCDCDMCQDISDSDPDLPLPLLYQNIPRLVVCGQCPGNVVNHSNSTSDDCQKEPLAGCSTSKGPDTLEAGKALAFVCGPNQAHVTCSCCFKPMPDRTAEAAPVKPQKCSLCHKIFCHMYLGCRRAGCTGCLDTFLELKFSAQELSNLILENTAETRILMDYEETAGRSRQDTVRSCLDRLDAGLCQLPVNLKSDSVLCRPCALLNLKSLAYHYRLSIQDAALPVGVTSRPDCYWGVNCRTQKHNMTHAQRYNHICNQTRF